MLLYVADDGPGSARGRSGTGVRSVLHHLRDPGEGTGLGLAIVARTVHDAGEPSGWIAPARAEPFSRSSCPSRGSPSPLSWNPAMRLLIVDDDADLRPIAESPAPRSRIRNRGGG
jgi:hypothetical protein